MNFQEINDRLSEAEPEAILDWAFKTFPYQIAMTSSFQASGVVLLHMIRKIAFGFPVFFIDTGFHFPETIEFRNRLTREWGLNVHVIIPTVSRKNLERDHGPFLHERDPDLCCLINKVTPLNNLKKEIGLKNWISAIRRDQSSSRRDLVPLMFDPDHSLRIHPLANWTRERVWAYIRNSRLPYHPLYDQGYTSIGCFPSCCTTKAGSDEDERMGRWEGREKLECGLHESLNAAETGRAELPPERKDNP
jgi:phosphoadenosine phosphosulfate reductase